MGGGPTWLGTAARGRAGAGSSRALPPRAGSLAPSLPPKPRPARTGPAPEAKPGSARERVPARSPRSRRSRPGCPAPPAGRSVPVGSGAPAAAGLQQSPANGGGGAGRAAFLPRSAAAIELRPGKGPGQAGEREWAPLSRFYDRWAEPIQETFLLQYQKCP
nr:translation initiation factor IF-2-like isoform X2 [Taeniopygia guttata]